MCVYVCVCVLAVLKEVEITKLWISLNGAVPSKPHVVRGVNVTSAGAAAAAAAGAAASAGAAAAMRAARRAWR
jgi:hypothetical protein